jgi:dipeptidyl aminopeptidase/acylaminoacyl peptidase
MVAAMRVCRRRALTASLVGCLASHRGSAQSSAGNQFTVDALLRLEGIGVVAPSPNGRSVAIVVQRPQGVHERYPMPWLQDYARSDIWIARTDGGSAFRLTDGSHDGAGYWEPVWSPDGTRLAMLSTKGGDAVRAYVWAIGDSTPHPASERAVDIWVVHSDDPAPFHPLTWSDDSTLIVPLLPSGADAGFDPFGEMEQRTMKEWAIVRSGGAVATANVLESYPDSVPAYLSTEDIVAINVHARSNMTLTTIPRDPTTSGQRGISLSPNGRTLAVITSKLEPPVGGQGLTRTMARYRVGLVDVARDADVRWIGEFSGEDDSGWSHAPLARWSPNGHALTIVGRRTGASAVSPCAFTIDVDAHNPGAALTFPSASDLKSASSSAQQAWQCLDATWSADSTSIIHARDTDGREGWWVATAGTPSRNITAGLAAASQLVVAASWGSVAYAVGEQEIWSVDIRSGRTRALLPQHLGNKQLHSVWAFPSAKSPHVPDLVIASYRTGASDTLYLAKIVGDSLQLERVGALRAGWKVDGYLPKSRAAVVEQRNRAVALVSPSGERELLGVNAWVAQLAQPRKMLIRYKSESGDSLDAVALLPTSYSPGRRYPMVTWVYAGQMYSDTAGAPGNLLRAGSLNLALLAARGYVVLFPSMPLMPGQSSGGDVGPRLMNGALPSGGSDVLPQLTSGVLPAVDRLVALGIADPDRVAVMGQSFGGYSTLGLVTQTKRFRTAIALAVISDFLSLYSTLRPWDRYRDYSQVNLANPKMAEAGQFRLGASPWTNLWRYLVNSPVRYADRVETPVMIMQGDLDPLGPEQAEEFFTALYRLGKRARLVRYVGEEHVIQSPGNVRDMWMRIDEWLSETMPPTTAEVPRTSRMTEHAP